MNTDGRPMALCNEHLNADAERNRLRREAKKAKP